MTNTGGGVTDTYLYDAFGDGLTESGPTVNPFLFDAQQYDAPTGDYYLRARFYDTTTGRFLSQDPFAGLEVAPLTLHRYTYAGNDPVNTIDPSGNFIEEDIAVDAPIDEAAATEEEGALEVESFAKSRLARLSAYFFATTIAIASVGTGLDFTDPTKYQPGKITFQADSNIFQVGTKPAQIAIRNRIDNEILSACAEIGYI